jgi:sugar lactone lactonase YvrE
MSLSTRHEGQPQVSVGCETVREGVCAQTSSKAGFGEMGKRCVRMAAVAAAVAMAIGAQAQTIATADLGANQVTLQLTSATTGTGYFTLLTGGAACGTAAQTVSGQSSTGAAATQLGSLPLTANVAGSYTVRNLTQSTAYTACFTPDGTTAPVSTTVTTAAAAALSSGAWAAVGSAGFSAGEAVYTSLAFSPNGTPYVAYEDYSHTDRATVMEYNGTGTSGWVPVGSAGFSANTAQYESLAFSPNGTPYVAYRDAGNGSKATVMEYNGGSWVTVGSAGFSANTATQESLAFSPNGTPYVAYDDFGHSNKATVMEYSGTGTSGWVPVGSAGFSAGTAGYESLAFSPNGTPYVAYDDAFNGGKATVMEFFTPPTATTTAATSVAGSSATLNGTVNDEGTATTVTFQYGTTTSYGTTVTATTPAGGIVAAGSGNTATAVGVSGLLPLTTYHYTVSATANGTTVNGSDMTFTTSGTQPTVTGLSPSFGAAAGGGTITITGTSLTGATAVSFGAAATTNVVVVSPTTVTATIPAGTAGSSVNVTVTTPNGTSAGSIYTYSALTSYTAPTTAVGAISATQTAYVNFTAAGTLTTIDVLTLGATGLDFNEITGGTCAAGTAYSIGQVCTVEYGFTPLHPGQRMGAVQLISSAGAVMGTSFISGIGSGPQVVFATTTTGVYLPSAQNTLGGGFSNPEAAAVDGSGNVYVADFSSSAVKEIPAGCASSSCVTTLGSGFSNPTGVAVDGAGNVYVADFGHSAVKEMVAVNGSIPASPAINTVGGGFSQAEGAAVDGSGNVYVGDTSHNAVKEMPSGCASSSCVTSLGGGFSNPSGVTVDGSGNVFVADTNNSVVKEIPFGCASSSCVTTLGSGFSNPQGVAVDGSGNVYVADTHHGAVKEMVAVGGSIPASPTILTLGSGFGLPFGVAVDGSGNVYVADNSNNVVKKLDFADPPSFSFATTYVYSSSADSPKTETITNIGNAALTFEVPGIGTNPAISLGFSIGNSSTCPQLSTGSSAGTLGVGASCTDLISFTPQVVGTIGGSTVTIDDTLNVANSTQSVGLSGTSLPLLTKTIAFPQPTTPGTVGSTATLTATASNGDPITYSITSGAATINGSTITYTNTGTVTIAANSAETFDYAAAETVSNSVVVNAAASSYTAPTEPVGNTSATQTATVNFTAAGTLASINVVTKGAPNLDFNFVSGGTCAVNTAYTAGQACTVLYSFTPLYPGAREGAVVLQTSGGSVLGTSYLGGTGIAPLGLFTTTSQTLSVTGLSGARGLSADGYGNLYVLETGNGKVDEIAAGTSTVTKLTTLGTGTGGTAVDGAGNLYVGISGVSTIYELVGGKLPAITLVTGTCGNDDNLEVDGAGNLYFSCYSDGAIYKMDVGSHALTQLLPEQVLPDGHPHRFIGMAVDAAGNIYAPDFNHNILYELPFGANSLTTLVTGGSLDAPHGVAVDPAGNIYVTNYSGSTYNVLRYAASGYALTQLPATGSRSIVIDGSGNLYTIQSNDATITGYARTTAPGLTFLNTPVGTSNPSLQTVEFENDGNEALTITSYSATTNFNVGGSGNTCATGSLASGATCSVGAQFAPTAVGALIGTASIVDNTLGVAGTSQVIPLSGTGTQGTPAITWATPAAITYGTPLSGTQLDASSTVAGTFSYSPASGVLTVGSHLLSVTFTSTDGTDYTSATSTVTLTVNRATPAITWATPAAITYGTPLSGTQLNAGSTVAGTYSYNPATGTVLGAGSHTLSVTFTPTDGTDYTTATSTVSLLVNQATQAITFTPPPSVVLYGVAPITLSATGGASGNAVVFSVLSGPASISGNQLTITGTGTVVVAADQLGNANYSAAAEVTQSVLVNQAPQSITFTALSVELYGVAPITLSATGGASGNAVVFSVLSGPASVSGNQLTITGTGTVVIAADQLGNTNYSAAAEVTQSVTVLPIVYMAPTEPVGTASGTQTATLLFNSSFTLGSINVLTQGAPGLDFNAASGGTCAVGSSYSAGQTCTVNYTFTPIAPGTRFGAITIVDNSTNLQASLYLIGSGTGPLALFSNGGQNAFQNTSGALNGITTDAAGNVYYTTFNTNNNGVYKVAVGSGITTPLVGGLQLGDGVAIDGAGNVFYTDYNAGTVNELLGGTGTPILIATEPSPEGLAFDAQGNLYVVVSGNQNVVKLLAGSFAPSTTYGTGLAHPQSVAVDASGNVYITDRDGNQAVVVTPDGTTQNTIATGITTPAGITLDAAGNIYIAVIGSAELEEFAAGTYTPTTLGSFVQPAFVALDPRGNVLVVDRGTNTIQELTRATPAPLSFATTSEGATSSDSPQTVTLTNDGNASLVLSSLATASANFSLSGSSTCSSSTTLVSNGTCNISVSFAPTSPGSPLTDAVTIADNNLNVAGAMQTVPLSGIGTQQTAVVTVAPATISYSTSSTTLSATVAYLGATAPIGGVIFTIDGGSAVPATCVGSASLLTCTASYPTGTLSATLVTLTHTIAATLAADTDFATTSGTATLTVTPIALTAAIVGNPTKTYDSTTAATLTSANFQLTGVVTGDSIIVNQPVGVYAAITAGPEAVTAVLAPAYFSAVSGLLTNYILPTVATGPGIINQATPTITWPAPAAITYGTALSGAQLNATASVDGTNFVYTPAAGTVLTAGSHLLSVTFTPTDTTDYTTATQTVSITVNQATPTITWPAPVAIAYGTALSAAQLNATASVPGSFSYSPASGVLTAGSQLLSVTFTPTDTTDYTSATSTVTLQVNQATPTITWAAPAAINYGTHLSATQLNATASVAGTFSYNQASGTVLSAGSHTLSVLFTPTDTTDYTTATATASITVAPIALTITAGSPTTIYGSTLSTIAPSYSGFISGDSASSLTTQPACTTTATSASNVGSYPTSCSGAADANYIISYKPGTLTVTPAVLTVAANKLTFAYGGGDGDNDADSTANPMTYTITGFALGQTAATDLTGTPSETSNTPEGGPVGSYTITMAAGSLKLKPAYSCNYTISYVSAPLTIVPAVLTVTAASQSDVYGGVDPDNCGHPERHLTYTITGFAYNQKQNQVLDGSPTLTTTATAKSNVGSYPITITQGSLSFDRNYASDYALVFVNGTLTVTPAKLNVVANSYSRQINQPNPAFGYTVNGFVNGDTQSSATTGAPACCSTTAVTGSPAGIYAITIAPGSLAAKNGNYTLNLVNGVLVVYNPRDRNDPHCDGDGNFSPNRQFDHDNWPDSSSYNYYWGNGGGGPNIYH